MEENKIINEGTVNEICEEVSNTKGGVIVKLAVAAISVAAVIGTTLFIRKKRKQNSTEAEVIESENDKTNEE